MAIWSKPLRWVKSKIRPARPAPPPPPPPEPPRRRPPREPEPPDDSTFDRLHLAYLAGRLRDLGMDSGTAAHGNSTHSPEGIDVLVQEIGAKNAIKVLDQQLDRVREWLANGTKVGDGWDSQAKAQIKRYTPKGQLPNYTALMPFWWYHPTRP
jgi:hypothetical protein